MIYTLVLMVILVCPWGWWTWLGVALELAVMGIQFLWRTLDYRLREMEMWYERL